MSDNGIKVVALAGLGTIGAFIADELLAAKAAGALTDVIILTRADTSHAAALLSYAARGAHLATVDYAAPDTLRAALSGVHAVVSALGGPGHALMHRQLALARAAAASLTGARLFVPSDFGNRLDDAGRENGRAGGEAFEAKAALYAQLEELGLAWATFYTGLFADFCFIPLLGFDFANRQVTVGGDGDVPVSFTARRDIARFVVHALTSFAPADLCNAVFRIEGSRKTFNELARIYERRHGAKVEVRRVPRAELEARLVKDPFDLHAVLHLDWAEGRGAVGEPLANDMWLEWKPTPVEELL